MKTFKPLVLLTLTLMLLGTFTSSASAQSRDLVRYAPGEAQFLIGFNADALRPAPAYEDFIKFLKNQPGISETLKVLEEDGGLNIEDDLAHILVALPEPVTDPSKEQTMTIAVEGTFEPERLIEAAKKRMDGLSTEKVKDQTHFVSGDLSFGFVTPKILVLTRGDSSFRDATWKAVGNKKASAESSSEVKRVLGQITTTRGAWVVGLTADLPQRGPKMNSAGITLDIVKGLKIDMVSNMASKEAADQAATEMDGLKSQTANPMVKMLGAGPLLDNLKVTKAKKRVNVATSMTASELETFIRQLAMTAAQGTQQITPSQGKPTDSPAKKKKGIDADFN